MVKEKFSLEENAEIIFQDIEGAELEEDVFDIFINQEKCPTVCFVLRNETNI